MAQRTKLVDGQNALEAQENALNMLEQMLAAEVIQYAKKTSGAAPGTTPNEAVLQDVPIGQQPHSLSLTAIDVAGDSSRAPAPQPGQSLVFSGIAYVSRVEKLVLGFRQTT